VEAAHGVGSTHEVKIRTVREGKSFSRTVLFWRSKMILTSRREAVEWVQAWEGRPRKGVLAEAIAGLKKCYAIALTQTGRKNSVAKIQDLGEALVFLDNLKNNLYGAVK
jgi:hypothetical protein